MFRSFHGSCRACTSDVRIMAQNASFVNSRPRPRRGWKKLPFLLVEVEKLCYNTDNE